MGGPADPAGVARSPADGLGPNPVPSVGAARTASAGEGGEIPGTPVARPATGGLADVGCASETPAGGGSTAGRGTDPPTGKEAEAVVWTVLRMVAAGVGRAPRLRRWLAPLAEQRGAASAEYALLLALVVIVLITALTDLGDVIRTRLSEISSALEEAGN